MSLSAAAMRMLADKGLTFDEIVAVAEANECDKAVSKGALRMRRLREKRSAEASPSVTKASHSVTDDPPSERHQSVTSRHIASPPRARVEDNPLRVIPLEAATAAAAEARGWPDGKAADWAKALVDTAATSRLDLSREPGLTMTLGELVRWRDAGAHWEFDVLNVVVTLANKRPRDGPIRSWKFFTDAVVQSVADNRKALEIPEASHERPNRNNPPRFADAGRQRADANFSGAALALNRRRGRQMGGDGVPAGFGEGEAWDIHEGGPAGAPRLLAGG